MNETSRREAERLREAARGALNRGRLGYGSRNSRKRKAQWTSSAKLTDTELLAIGDEELQTFIAPMVRSVSGRLLGQAVHDRHHCGSAALPHPPRATAGTIYDVSIVDSAGNTRRLLKRSASDLYMTRFGWITTRLRCP